MVTLDTSTMNMKSQLVDEARSDIDSFGLTGRIWNDLPTTVSGTFIIALSPTCRPPSLKSVRVGRGLHAADSEELFVLSHGGVVVSRMVEQALWRV